MLYMRKHIEDNIKAAKKEILVANEGLRLRPCFMPWQLDVGVGFTKLVLPYVDGDGEMQKYDIIL